MAYEISLCDKNGGYLEQAATTQAASDERLCDPAGGIGSRAVNLGPVLARKGSTSVCPPASVRVDNDLSAGKARVALMN